MKAVLSRKYGKNETCGSLFVLFGFELMYSCKTIELPWNNNQHNYSCVPEGSYNVVKYDSPNKGMVFLLENVLNREGILIHSGNYVSGNHIDSKGCILPGSFFEDINGDGMIDICESRKTMDMLLKVLPDKFELIII
jgi:hypothetical protein